MCLTLCCCPFQVFLCSRHQSDVDACVQQLSAKGFKVQGAALDVAQAPQRQQLVQQVSQAFGGTLNILGTCRVIEDSQSIRTPGTAQCSFISRHTLYLLNACCVTCCAICKCFAPRVYRQSGSHAPGRCCLSDPLTTYTKLCAVCCLSIATCWCGTKIALQIVCSPHVVLMLPVATWLNSM